MRLRENEASNSETNPREYGHRVTRLRRWPREITLSFNLEQIDETRYTYISMNDFDDFSKAAVQALVLWFYDFVNRDLSITAPLCYAEEGLFTYLNVDITAQEL